MIEVGIACASNRDLGKWIKGATLIAREHVLSPRNDARRISRLCSGTRATIGFADV